MTIRSKNTPMMAGPAPRDSDRTYQIHGFRLMDGETDAEKTAREAKEKADADAVVKAAADKAEADRIAAEKAEAEKNKGLTDKEAELLKDVMKHKDAAKTAKAEAAAAAKALEAYKGLDPAKVAELIAASEKAEADKVAADKLAAEKAGDFERVKQMMADEHAKALGVATTAAATSATALEAALATINDLTVGSAFNTSPFITDELVLTAPIARTVFGANFDVVDGAVVAYDKPRGTKDRTELVDASGKRLGFEDAIKKLVDSRSDRDRLLRASLKTGAGSKTTDTKKPGDEKTNELTGAARIAAALSAGAMKKKP